MNTKYIIPHKIIQNAIEDNWFETNPSVSDDEISQMAIGIAGEVDEFIRERDRLVGTFCPYRENIITVSRESADSPNSNPSDLNSRGKPSVSNPSPSGRET